MKDVSQWLSELKQKEESSVYLEDVLLGKPFSGYAWRRLRFFSIGLLLDIVIHSIEFLFLRQIFSGSALTTALLLRAGSLFFKGWWWGGLEVMRSEIRQLHRASRSFQIPRLVAEWLSASTLVAAVILGTGIGWIGYRALFQQVQLLDLFSFTVCVGMALEVFIRTYHSGMYAVRRIYRPVWITLGIEVAGIIVFACLWPLLHRNAFSISSLCLAFAHSYVTFVYVSRSYQFSNLVPETLTWKLAVGRALKVILSGRFMLAGLASSFMRFESLLIFFVVGFHHHSPHSISLLLSLYVISPLIRAAHDWAMLFYFDFTRLELSFFERYRKLFQKPIYYLSWLVGLVLWGLSLVTIALFETGLSLWLALILLPFFLVRSVLGFSQVRAFSERRYLDLIAGGVLLCLGAYLIVTVHQSIESSLILFSALLFLILFILSRQLFGVFGGFTSESTMIIPLHTFLSKLVASKEPVTVGVLSFAEEIEEQKALYLSEILKTQSRYFQGGFMSQVSARQVIWFYPNTSEGLYAIENLAAESGGLISALDQIPYATDGEQALSLAIKKGFLGNHLTAGPDQDLSDDTLLTHFKTFFPEGKIFEPGMSLSRLSEQFAMIDARSVIHAAIHYTRGFLPQRLLSPFEVSALCRSGDLRYIFLVPNRAPRQIREEWFQSVRQANIQDALLHGLEKKTRVAARAAVNTVTGRSATHNICLGRGATRYR